ncbi:hypothetical protein EIM50_13715 [Pseudoxanthomonas sp. SGD-10]|nr:hypothetical protein EIM50_13715 [Pseudoxanthomonas sp. SGD-10]
MTTIIRRYRAPAAFASSLVVDLEPDIDFPAETLGAYRLKVDYDFSAPNRAGTWPAMTQGSSGTRVYTKNSLQITGGQNVASGQLFPEDKLTIICVVKQNDTGQNAFIAGVCDGTSNANTAFGIHTSSSGANFAARWGSNVISFAMDGGERYEMIAAAWDRESGDMKLYRPRTGTEQAGSFTESVSPSGQFQILGESGNPTFPGLVEGLWTIAVNDYMSKAAIDALYADVQSSLAANGIVI